MLLRATSLEKYDGNIMPEASLPQRLEACDAPIDVQLGELVTLDPEPHTHAVSLKLLRGQHCFVFMGTSHGSAISMTRIATIETGDLVVVKGQSTIISADVDYIISVRSVLGAYLKRPELFYAPVAWLFSSNLDDPWRTIIQRRILTSFRLCHGQGRF